MGQIVKLILLCSAAYYSTYFILSRLTPHAKELRDYMRFAIALVALTALSHSIIIGMMVGALLVFFITRGKSNEQRIAFFFGVIFVLPPDDAIRFYVGINMGALDYPTLMAFCLLVPMLLFQAKDRHFCKLNTLDKFVLAFFVWQILLYFRFPSITSTFRESFWLALQYIVPYLAIRYFTRDYYLVLVAIAFALLSQMFISCMEGVLGWKMYESLKALVNYPDFRYSMYKFRHGFLRTEAVFGNPLIIALFSNFAFLITYIIFKKPGIEVPASFKKWLALGAIGVAFVGAFMTGSRAGLAGIVIIVVAYHAAMWASRRKRDPKKMLVSLAAIGIVSGLVIGKDFIEENFDYRYRLFETSTAVLKASPFTGYVDPHTAPGMEVMLQGEGIVDIVNSYIYFALKLGLPGLFLFLIVIFTALSRVYFVIRHVDDERYALGLFLFCSLAILAFNLATTSPIGWTYGWVWLLIPLCSNLHTRHRLEAFPPVQIKPS